MALEVGDKRAKQFVIRRMRRLAPRRSGNLLEKGANERGCQLWGLTNERNVRSAFLPFYLPPSTCVSMSNVVMYRRRSREISGT